MSVTPVPLPTQINGRLLICAAIVNHRTEAVDVDRLEDSMFAASGERTARQRGRRGGAQYPAHRTFDVRDVWLSLADCGSQVVQSNLGSSNLGSAAQGAHALTK